MSRSFNPRLSEAIHLLPALRAQLSGAASHRSLPINLALDLLPIVEDGLFRVRVRAESQGVHVPDDRPRRNAGNRCCAGACIARRRRARSDSPPSTAAFLPNTSSMLGTTSSSRTRAFRTGRRQRKPLWAALEELFADFPRRPVVIHDGLHQVLDAALAAARTRLAGM